ncbi:MAG: ribonuclease HIII [Ignavibacteriales bacterium]|nr:ribonuclease HIII [Ignavibacteriales bacterium]MCF8306939.1 ribonuclease HIII [Ignavibacteriales bacterium]MCF8437379.1 ribonuclease HIII [Ignavibacteriales bacterium]
MISKKDVFTEINSLKSRLIDENLVCGDIILRDYNYEFEVASQKDRLKIQYYFGKKGLKKVVQGKLEGFVYNQVSSIMGLKKPEGFSLEDNTSDTPDLYIGSDEAGKGDFFGPLVVCAFLYDNRAADIFTGLGIRDSKELTDQKINQLAIILENSHADHFETVLIGPEKYNELYSKFKNLNYMLNWAHSRAVTLLLEKSNTTGAAVIVDKFSSLKLNIDKTIFPAINVIYETKAEKYPGVAAASIIARSRFNKWFIQKEKEGLSLPKGASNEAEAKAVKLYSGMTHSEFVKLCKTHFKTFSRVTTSLGIQDS